jgi:NAD(P)-dependent dehydrogenase (short-subunit alcohol dehydrogenase family)
MGNDLFDLTGKVALVTGGNSGIGLGMAEGLAGAGATVCVWGTNEVKNDAAVARLRELGATAVARQVDVADEAAVVAGVEALVAEHGRLDACFANAAQGSGQSTPRFVDSALADWQRMMRTNLDGTYLTLREAAKVLVGQGEGGSLVATSSIAARFGSPREQAYSASKAGVLALVRSLAVELGRHAIRVNGLMPGWTVTAQMEPWLENPAVTDKVLPRIPLRRWGRVEEWAGIAVYLASNASSFHTGDVMHIDGGYSVF